MSERSEETKELNRRTKLFNAKLQSYAPASRKFCTWTYDATHYKWDTTCDQSFMFGDGPNSPTENCFKHCCYCGRNLIEKTEEVADGA